MAGVERFELPTRADFWYGESTDLFVVGDLNYTDVKNPHISVEASLKMAGVKRFELPTRDDFWYGESADIFVVGDLIPI